MKKKKVDEKDKEKKKSRKRVFGIYKDAKSATPYVYVEKKQKKEDKDAGGPQQNKAGEKHDTKGP